MHDGFDRSPSDKSFWFVNYLTFHSSHLVKRSLRPKPIINRNPFESIGSDMVYRLLALESTLNRFLMTSTYSLPIINLMKSMPDVDSSSSLSIIT
jgi:hypothetical protein